MSGGKIGIRLQGPPAAGKSHALRLLACLGFNVKIGDAVMCAGTPTQYGEASWRPGDVPPPETLLAWVSRWRKGPRYVVETDNPIGDLLGRIDVLRDALRMPVDATDVRDERDDVIALADLDRARELVAEIERKAQALPTVAEVDRASLGLDRSRLTRFAEAIGLSGAKIVGWLRGDEEPIVDAVVGDLEEAGQIPPGRQSLGPVLRVLVKLRILDDKAAGMFTLTAEGRKLIRAGSDEDAAEAAIRKALGDEAQCTQGTLWERLAGDVARVVEARRELAAQVDRLKAWPTLTDEQKEAAFWIFDDRAKRSGARAAFKATLASCLAAAGGDPDERAELAAASETAAGAAARERLDAADRSTAAPDGDKPDGNVLITVDGPAECGKRRLLDYLRAAGFAVEVFGADHPNVTRIEGVPHYRYAARVTWREDAIAAVKRAARLAVDASRAEHLLGLAYAEIRKQVFGSKVVFDREIVELAQAAAPDRERAAQPSRYGVGEPVRMHCAQPPTWGGEPPAAIAEEVAAAAPAAPAADRQAYYGETVQPWDLICALGWGIPFAAGNVVKYVGRADRKGTALADLEKARVYLGWLIDLVKKREGAA